jgi:predicted Rossmann fold flavoprotein
MFEVIIIGAGPAGLMAGIMSEKKTLIIEKNDIAGKKLLITGGGRCNVTNNKENREFLNQIEHNKKYLYSTINNFGPKEIINFFETHNVSLKEEEDGKMFPKANKSFVIKEALLNAYKGKINYNEDVEKIIKENDYYIVITNKNEYKTQKLVIATGGSSYKITGSTGDNLKFAKMLKQPVTEIYPAEIGVKLKKPTDIPGQSIDNVIVKAGKRKKEGNLLYTHTGLSGSSVMLISEYIFKDKINEIEIDLLPKYNEEEIKNILNNYDRNKEVHTFLEQYFSKRFSEYLLNYINLEKNIKIKQLNHKELNKLVETIKHIKYNVKNNEEIDLAYVTAGGIDLKYINTKTFESTINKNLYFVGEALDIHGPIGGYNITLALSTGYSAGVSL